MLLAVLAVCTHYHITEGTITLGCNNLGGVRKANANWVKVNQNTRHADIIWAIRRIQEAYHGDLGTH
jgi:hypothetical protein